MKRITVRSIMTETAEAINVFPPVDSWTIVLDRDPKTKKFKFTKINNNYEVKLVY